MYSSPTRYLIQIVISMMRTVIYDLMIIVPAHKPFTIAAVDVIVINVASAEIRGYVDVLV